MEGAADEIFPPQERPRTGGLQGDTARTRPFPQSSSYNSFSTGDQFNAPGGTQNISNGSGNQFPGATFQQPVYFNTNEHFDPLRDCLRSLAFPEMDSRFNDIDAAANGTCEWLLQHETYTSWASRDRGLLWIKGKPGSGKSTLLRYVLGRAMAIPNSREGALILSFFFHGRGSELQKMPLGLFRSLLHQLLRQVPEALTGLVDTFKQRCETVGKAGEKWQWHPGELLRLFESSLPKVLETRPVWLFVDALDECGKDNAVKLVEDFESMLHSLPSSDLKQFRICFTCRHYPILGLDGVFEVCVEEENWKDISAFVQDKLSSFRKRTSSTIPDLITNRADGVFLWAWLMVEQVLDLEREGVGLKKIEAVILSVPQELDALYHELIRNMASDSLKLVQWICFAMRPLSLNELRWAMLVDADCPHRSLYECQSAGDYPFDDDGMKRRVQTLSRGLAEVTSDAKVVQFIHQSVKDFFVEKDLSALDETAKPDFVVGMAHHRLSRTCIRYLEMEEIGQSAIRESDHLRSEFPFLHYATTSWIVHVKQSETKASQGGLPDHFSGVSEAIVQRWARIYRIIEPFSSDQPPEKISTAHIVSRYQLIGQLRLILKRVHQVRTYVNAKDEYGRTPLLYAAERGYLAVVKELLENGADPNSGDDEGRTPLLYAAERGYLAVVKELVKKKAKINAQDKINTTALHWAAWRGHKTVISLLLENEANIKAKDEGGATPLAWAIESGSEKSVKMLLDKNSKVNYSYRLPRWLWLPLPPLDWRPDRWLDRWPPLRDLDWDDDRLLTPLLRAVERGDVPVVTLLLEEGASPDSEDNCGQSPLSVAKEGGNETIIQKLETSKSRMKLRPLRLLCSRIRKFG